MRREPHGIGLIGATLLGVLAHAAPARAWQGPDPDGGHAVLSGRVLDAGAAPVDSAEVLLLAAARGPEGVGPALFRKHPRHAVQTDAEGCFWFGGLAAGSSYDLVVRAEGHARAVLRRLEPAAAGTGGPIDVCLEPGARAALRVLDPGGRPLSGAEVWDVRGLTAPPSIWCLEGAGALRPLQLGRAGPDGLVEIGDEPPGTWQWLVRAEGHVETVVRGSARPVRLGEAEPGQELIQVQLRPGAEVGGRILSGNGEPVPGLRVVATHELDPPDGPYARIGDCWPADRTDAEGRFRIRGLDPGPPAAGRVLVWGVADDGTPRTGRRSAALGDGDLELRVLPAGTWRIGIEGRPSLRGQMDLYVHPPRDNGAPAWRQGVPTWAIAAAEGGAILVQGIRAEGPLELTVELPGGETWRSGPVDPPQGTVDLGTIRLGPAAPAPRAPLEVRVIDAGGSPLRGAEVEFGVPFANLRAAADAEGLVLFEWGRRSRARVRLAGGQGHAASEWVEVAAPDADGERRRLVLVARAGATLRGRIEGLQESSPPEARRVVARRNWYADLPPYETVAAPDGAFEMPNLIPGPYSVYLPHWLELGEKQRIAMEDAVPYGPGTWAFLREGTTSQVRLRVPTHHRLDGRVLTGGEPLGGAAIELRRGRGLTPEGEWPARFAETVAETFSGHDGRFQLEGVPEGVYQLRARAPGGVAAVRVFELLGGDRELELPLDLGDASLVARVSSPPVDGGDVISLTARWEAEPEGTTIERTAAADDAGRLSLQLLPRERSLELELRAQGHLARTRSLDALSEAALDLGELELPAPASLVLYAGASAWEEELWGRLSYLGPSPWSQLQRELERIHPEAHTRISGLQPGRYRISVGRRPEGTSGSGELEENWVREVRLEAGTSVSVDLP